jgi:DNA invertase Pin-like site-specific DNA recombinase
MEPTNKAKIAYSYVRFSTLNQAAGDSRRRQTEWAEEWAEANGYILDKSLRDEGVSAYHGKNSEEGSLASFIECIKKGMVAAGSILLVENLDRLSRQTPMRAFNMICGIIAGGVEIQTREERLTADSEMPVVMMAVITLCRGHSESAAKSVRITEAWKTRRAGLATKPITGHCPAWLRLENGKWKIIEQAAATIKRIFTMAAGGQGALAISKRLNKEKVSPIGKLNHWSNSYTRTILNSKSTIGEYQPYTGVNYASRKPHGLPIPNYSPSIITDDLYYQAQAGKKARTRCRGRRGDDALGASNLFQGLLIDARDGKRMHLIKKYKNSPSRIVSSGARIGLIEYVSFPYAALESALLRFLTELAVDDVELADNKAEIATLEGKHVEIEMKLEKIERIMIAGEGDFDSLLKVQAGLEKQRKAIRDGLDARRAEEQNSKADVLCDTQKVITRLENAMGQDRANLRDELQGRIRLLVKAIIVLCVRRGNRARAYVNIHYRGDAGGVRIIIVDAERGKLVDTWYGNKRHEKTYADLDLGQAAVRRRLSVLGEALFPRDCKKKATTNLPPIVRIKPPQTP